MKNEDFLKNAQNWPLGGATGGKGKNVNKNSFIIEQFSTLQHFYCKEEEEKEQFWTLSHCAHCVGKEEEQKQEE